MVNPTTAFLGLFNVALYAGPYTWMKRRSTWNTSLGCIVGAVPPLMGWTACGGTLIPSPEAPLQFIPPFTDLSVIPMDNPLAPLALFLFLYSWQFAHFNPLSHMVRSSYAQAGYKMLSVLKPSKNTSVALRHALFLTPICSVLIPGSGIVSWLFALTSLPPNAVLAWASWKFWKSGSEKDARVLFRHCLWYLPTVFGLMMVHKTGVNWLGWIPQSNDEEKAVD
jgi:protoheme IX farnesyltransferase